MSFKVSPDAASLIDVPAGWPFWDGLVISLAGMSLYRPMSRSNSTKIMMLQLKSGAPRRQGCVCPPQHGISLEIKAEDGCNFPFPTTDLNCPAQFLEGRKTAGSSAIPSLSTLLLILPHSSAIHSPSKAAERVDATRDFDPNGRGPALLCGDPRLSLSLRRAYMTTSDQGRLYWVFLIRL